MIRDTTSDSVVLQSGYWRIQVDKARPHVVSLREFAFWSRPSLRFGYDPTRFGLWLHGGILLGPASHELLARAVAGGAGCAWEMLRDVMLQWEKDRLSSHRHIAIGCCTIPD